eukprot:267233_1
MWVYNDIEFKKHIPKTQHIFMQHGLSGKKIIILSIEDTKCIVKKEMFNFVTSKTFDIMFDGLSQWKMKCSKNIESKSATEIAYFIYNYPLNCLISQIKKQQLDGKR